MRARVTVITAQILFTACNVALSQRDRAADSLLCLCDLLLDQCDSGCCCDRDCTAAETAAVPRCLPARNEVWTRMCDQTPPSCSAVNGSGPCSTTATPVVSSGLWCIYRDNSGTASRFVSPSPLLDEFSLASLLSQRATRSFYTSSSSSRTSSSSSSSSASIKLRSGDPIIVRNQRLNLPWSLMGAECSNNNPAGFLMDRAGSCVQTVSAVIVHCVGGGLLDMNRLGNTTTITTVRRMIVVQDVSVVVRAQSNSADFSPRIRNGLCENVLLGAHYTVTYDPSGQVNSTVEVTLGSVSENATSVVQTFSVTQQPADGTPISVSGNPGYVFGKPLRAGVLNGSQVLESGGPWRVGVPVPFSSLAWHDCGGPRRAPPQYILFGVNARLGCKLRLSAAGGLSSVSVCSALLREEQRWLGRPLWVASFGNASNSEPADWLMVRNDSAGACPVGVCALHVTVTVLWVTVGSLTAPQAKVIGASVRLRYRTAAQCPSTSSLDVISVVHFLRRPAPPPLLATRAVPLIDARLPTNLFFPFLQSPAPSPTRPAPLLCPVMAAAALLVRAAGV